MTVLLPRLNLVFLNVAPLKPRFSTTQTSFFDHPNLAFPLPYPA
ncbi:hypothetical protein [Spirosoma sp. KNUC1025]